MSWKMIYLALRNPALAPEDFPQAWREHSALGAGCTNVRDKVKSVRQCSRDLDNTARLAGASKIIAVDLRYDFGSYALLVDLAARGLLADIVFLSETNEVLVTFAPAPK